MLTLNFDVDHELHSATTAPPALDSFSNSPAANAITSPNSCLSPPDTGLHPVRHYLPMDPVL